MLRKNVAGQFIHFSGVNATTGAALTGATFSVRRCIDGTFAAGGATITEDTGLGFYKAALTQADTNGNDLGFFFTATNAIPVCINALTTAADPSDTVRLGLTALPNAAAEASGGLYTRGTGAGQIAQDANGNVRVNLDTIKTNPVVNAGTVTFPTTATLASTTNITAGTITTVTNLTNLPAITANWLTAAGTAADFGAEIADAVWDEATAGHASAGSTGLALTSASAPTAAAVADAVWDEAISGHVAAGSTGEALSAAGGAGDPWITALPGAYSAGQAGKIVGDYLNATVSSRATQTSVDTIDGYLDTEIAAIKAKTDNLPAAPAAVGDIPTATQNADALLNRDMSAVSDTNARSPLNAMRFLRNKWSVAAGTLTVTKENDSTSAWTATISTDAAAVPVIGSDPA